MFGTQAASRRHFHHDSPRTNNIYRRKYRSMYKTASFLFCALCFTSCRVDPGLPYPSTRSVVGFLLQVECVGCSSLRGCSRRGRRRRRRRPSLRLYASSMAYQRRALMPQVRKPNRLSFHRVSSAPPLRASAIAPRSLSHAPRPHAQLFQAQRVLSLSYSPLQYSVIVYSCNCPTVLVTDHIERKIGRKHS